MAGPAVHPYSYTIIPSDVRSLAAWVIGQCVHGEGGIGGFGTLLFENMVNYVNAPTMNFNDPYPSSSTFFTLSVTGPIQKTIGPGDLDPMIPLMFSETGKAGQPERKLEDHDSWYLTALGLSGNMLAGGQKPWWKYRENQDTTTQNDEMAYECDANLGAPSEIDCTRLEYSELGVPSDTVTILAGIPKMLFSGMCNLAISTLVTITITWAQVSAALDTLIDYCVSTQRPALGGKAYYKSSNNNRGRRKRVTSQVS
ncbi:hypothetical protein MMC12_004444, partial [Toensbergia leucococca]|nr:hypothetical protein [Toensbergia leucococca]